MASVRNLLGRGLHRCVGPFVPPRVRLPFDYQIARLLGCEPELTLLGRLGVNRGVALDAGANRGLYTYRLARFYDRVHAFEINQTLADRLKKLAPPNVMVHPVGLSSQESARTLFIPIRQGRMLDGWASLEPGTCPGVESYVENTVHVRRLDDFHLEDVTFVKVDVEGHEVELLEGACETLRRNRPVILMEIKEANLASVRTILAELGYTERSLVDLTGVAGAKENYLFLAQ